MRQLQFKFDPLPAESAEICLFHQRWIKTFETQPLCQLCIKYVLVFYKIYLIQFCNKYLVGPSQKSSFRTLKKWKMFFCQKTHFSWHIFKDIYLISCLLLFLKTYSHLVTQWEGFSFSFWIFSGHKIADMILTRYF